MKKLFALLAIVGFVACNNAETTAPAVDTTAPVAVDTTVAPVAAPAAH